MVVQYFSKNLFVTTISSFFSHDLSIFSISKCFFTILHTSPKLNDLSMFYKNFNMFFHIDFNVCLVSQYLQDCYFLIMFTKICITWSKIDICFKTLNFNLEEKIWVHQNENVNCLFSHF